MALNEKILVIDDDPSFSTVVSQFLENQGFSVLVCHDGTSALQEVQEKKPDLIVLDLGLPDVYGGELLKKIKKMDPDSSVIVVTGFGGEQVAVEMMRRGAVDFISKPFEMKVLLSAVKDAQRLRQARLETKRDESLPTLENFFPFLAHEIRNPLHAIGGALAVIQRRADLQDEPLARSVQIIKEEVQHLTEFVQECLDFVRPVNRRVFTEININDLLAVVLNIAHHIFAEDGHKIKVATDFFPGLPAVLANYDELKQAFLNIVKNNFEAMLDQGGELKIISRGQADPEPGWVEVLFIDQGPGINKENIKNIFVPFFTTKLKGTGLGLPICHRIFVERHGGRMAIESEEGQGTTISVQLPVR